MSCPLCTTPLRQHLLLLDLAIVACPNTGCVYPFNLLMAEIQELLLLSKVTEREIMSGMEQKLVDAAVDTKLAEFISREDPELYTL